MQTTPAQERAGTSSRPVAHTVDQFEGRFRAIPTIQLCLVWWLYRESQITRRQLRVYFALQEMDERRRYTKAEEGGKKRKPFYTAAELASLVGGRGNEKAEAELKADVRKLQKIGLVQMSQQAVRFARSPDQINVSDLQNFWTFWSEIPNRSRSVPVPRRTLRALAAGFSMAVTGVLIAMMIRSLHWHKREEEFRVDGRTKGSWISDVFGLSRRAVTDARSHLIDLGWISPQETTQPLLNRFGNHDKINVAWSHKDSGVGADNDPGNASPSPEKPVVSASPLKTENLSSNEEDLKNKKLETESVPDLQLVGDRAISNGAGSGVAASVPLPVPLLRAIDARHLRDTASLLEIHQQAIAAKLSDDSEASRLNFFALAERAKSRGVNPQALFIWLLRNRKFEFITQADEDAATRRLKDHFYPPRPRSETQDDVESQLRYSDEDRIVKICFDVARQNRIPDPFTIASRAKQWSRQKWEQAREHFELRFGALS